MTLNDLSIQKLVNLLPPKIRDWVKTQPTENLVEIVLDYGRTPELHYTDGSISHPTLVIEKKDISYILESSLLSKRTMRNRIGVEDTLHRVSCIEDRGNQVVGLTLRIGRDFSGTINIIKDLIDSGENILFLGRPGVGKTSKLRETARYLSTDKSQRVIIVDSSNEIAGEGSKPHSSVGKARRMMVPFHKQQFEIMLEALENHTPQVIIIDEISHIKEAQASKTIAERGVQLLATAHGNTLENILNNDPLKPLVGTIKDQTMTDEYYRRTGQKSRLERIMPPTFTKIIELHGFDEVAIYHNVAEATDCILEGGYVTPEIRRATPDGNYVVIQHSTIRPVKVEDNEIHNYVIKENPKKSTLKGRKSGPR